MNISILIIGFSAVIFSAISSMPQLYKIITTKKVRDINIYFFICRILAAILYFIYGIIEIMNPKLDITGEIVLNITDIYVDDHLAPRLISASTDSATSNVNSTKLQPYVVWGCGDHARRIFERIGVSNVQYFVDSSIDSPQEFMACPAYNPSSLSTSKTPPRVFIASTQSYPEIKKQLKAICNDFYIIDTPF